MIHTASNWQSVIAWGMFEKLKGEEAAQATKVLTHSLISYIAGSGSLHDLTQQIGSGETKTRPTITVYRIRLTEKTGCFETPDGTDKTDAIG